MINVIIFFIIFNDVELPLLVIAVLLPGAAHPVLGRLPLALGSPVLEPDLHLRLGQIQGLGELLALLPHHVLVLLEGLLELEQLAGREGGADSLWFAERKKELG